MRPDPKHVEELTKICNAIFGKPKKTPCRSDVAEIDQSDELDDARITNYRSIVGKLMYIFGERPDAQYGIHCLAKSMTTPTVQSLKHAKQMVCYVAGTRDYGVKLKYTRVSWTLACREREREMDKHNEHLLEIITGADLQGTRLTEKVCQCVMLSLICRTRSTPRMHIPLLA